MTDILAPRPMTLAEVADLVRRAGGRPRVDRRARVEEPRAVGVLSMVSPSEKRAIDAAARGCGLTTSQWLRLLALERAGDERTLRLLAAAVRDSEASAVDEHPDRDVARGRLAVAAFAFAECLSTRDRGSLLRLAKTPRSKP